MAIRRYVASADNTITNAFNDGLGVRATGSSKSSHRRSRDERQGGDEMR